MVLLEDEADGIPLVVDVEVARRDDRFGAVIVLDDLDFGGVDGGAVPVANCRSADLA